MNPLGRTISLTALGVALVLAALAALAAVNVIDFRAEIGSESANLWGAAVLAALGAASLVAALRPTWSITVGRRGLGVKKLWRQRFVEWKSFEQVLGIDVGTLRIVTRRGVLKIVPRLPDAKGFADHAKVVARKTD